MNAAKQEIIARFNEGESALNSALAGLDPESSTAKPAPDQWSIVEIVEHLAASEAFLLDRLQAAQRRFSRRSRARSSPRYLALNRERKIDAPGPVLPAALAPRSLKLSIVYAPFAAQTIQLVQNFSGDLRSSLVEHPLITRPLNCYEMLLLIALHPIRHAAQINAIRQSRSADPES